MRLRDILKCIVSNIAEEHKPASERLLRVKINGQNLICGYGGTGSFEFERTRWVEKREREGAAVEILRRGSRRKFRAPQTVPRKRLQEQTSERLLRVKINGQNLICGYGGTGRRAGFRFQSKLIRYRFKSCYPHHKKP